MISVFSGDEGSPVYAETPRGKVIIAVLSSMRYTCKQEPSEEFDSGAMMFAPVSGALVWIYSQLDMTTYEEHPYFVAIMKERPLPADPSAGARPVYLHHCNGAFVARDFVISSARCFFDESMKKLDITRMRIQYGTNSVYANAGYGVQFGTGIYLDIERVLTTYEDEMKGIPAPPDHLDSQYFDKTGDYALVQFKPPEVLNYKYLLLPGPFQTLPSTLDPVPTYAYMIAAGRTTTKREYDPTKRKYRMKMSALRFLPGVRDCSGGQSLFELCSTRGWVDARTCESKCAL